MKIITDENCTILQIVQMIVLVQKNDFKREKSYCTEEHGVILLSNCDSVVDIYIKK